MRARLNIFQVFSAFVLGVVIAYGINPAVADITYQAASFLSSRVDALGTAINFYVGGTGIASIEAGGILPFTDGNNSISNLGASNRGYKNIYLSDGTNRSSLIQSNGLYIAGPSGQSILFRNGSTDVWSISSAGVLTQNATNGGSLIMAKAATSIIQGAASIDSDVTGVSVANPNVGIFADQSSNGGIVNISNGANGAGAAYYAFQTRSTTGSDANTIVQNGDVISHWRAYAADGASYRLAAQIRALVDGAPGSSDMPGALEFLTTADGGTTHTVALKLGNDKAAAFTGTVTSSRTTDFGWTVVDQADNQACTTGCTSAAVFGINLAAGATAPVIVGPSDATADVCLCAGAS